MSVEVGVYYEDSSGRVLCFRHAVIAAIKNKEKITTKVEVDVCDDDSTDTCFGLYVRECYKCKGD